MVLHSTAKLQVNMTKSVFSKSETALQQYVPSMATNGALLPCLWQDLSICLRERIHEAMPEKMAGIFFLTNSLLLPTWQSMPDLEDIGI